MAVILLSCSPKTGIVYFKEPKHKGYETSKSHLHGKMHKPNFIPIRNNVISSEIVDHYKKMYKHMHYSKSKDDSSVVWLLGYLLLALISSGISLLI